jgi:hypothetical protein
LKTDVTSDFSVTAITTLALLHISSSAVGSTTQWSPICRSQNTITFSHPAAYKHTPTAHSYVSMSLARGFSGLEVACWPLVPKFAGSHLAEAVGFLGQKKSSARLPSEGK